MMTTEMMEVDERVYRIAKAIMPALAKVQRGCCNGCLTAFEVADWVATNAPRSGRHILTIRGDRAYSRDAPPVTLSLLASDDMHTYVYVWRTSQHHEWGCVPSGAIKITLDTCLQ